MRKITLILLLALLCSSAEAEWLDLGSADNTTAFIDPATVRRNESIVIMWVIFNYTEAQEGPRGKPYFSMKAEEEFRCREEQWRILRFSMYSKNMAAGRTVRSFTYKQPDPWREVPAESLTEQIWKYACPGGRSSKK